MENKTLVTDGGRTADGFFAEKEDCAVRATACALDIPYYQAHKLFAHFGRKNGERSYTEQTLFHIGVEFYPFGHSFARWLELHSKGVYIVRIKGHAFTVKDGVTYDTGAVSGRRTVKSSAKIEGGRP